MGSTPLQTEGDEGSITHFPVARLDFIDARYGEEPTKRIDIFDNQYFKIGRHAASNDLRIGDDDDNMVSRGHCEVYTVVYEPGVVHVYVRDRKSVNGTYVNGLLIGTGPSISPGYLLQDGDVIEIRPLWKLKYHEKRGASTPQLTKLQSEECQQFSHKYLLTNRCLGQGAEAVVYLATDANSNKQLVCKVVNLDELRGQNGRERVRRKFQETDILRQLQHPNILPYIDAVSSPHTLYTFTELAPGGDLMSFLYRYDEVSELTARIVIRQIVHGLAYLHSKGIVHRDLKPENVLFACSSRIAYHRVMLSDFGCSAVPRRSRMTTFVGTMQYQAPEFQKRTSRQTAAVDIWSLGLVALLLVTPKHALPDDFGLKGQSDVNSYLTDSFGRKDPCPSSKARDFIGRCLRVLPDHRISTRAAECHDWLCTPEKSLEFFRRFDKKMISDWAPQTQLKPIPWDLESLKNALDDTGFSTAQDQQGPYIDFARLGSTVTTEWKTSSYFLKHEEDENDLSLSSIPPQFNPPPTWAESTGHPTAPPTSKSTTEKTTLQTSSDETQKTKSKYKISKRGKVPKFQGNFFLPVAGLDRHLRQPQTSAKREEVLRELKKTSSKFLTGKSPSQSPVSSGGTACPVAKAKCKSQKKMLA